MTTGPGEDADAGSGALNRGELQHRAVRGVMWTLIHIFVSLPVGFVVNIVIARVLGAVDYGRLAFLTAAMEVAGGIVALGVTPALVQFGAKAHAAGRRDEVRRLLSQAQGFRLLVVAPLLSVFVVAVARTDPVIVVLAVVFGVLMPAALDGAPACLGIENKTAAGARVVLVSALMTQAAVLIVALTLATADAIWAARLVMTAGVVALALVPVSPDYRGAILRPRLPRGLPPGFWRFSIPAGAASIISTLVLSRSEIFILTWFSMPAAAGAFALAFGLAGHLFAPAQAIIGPLVPAISGLHEVDSASVAPAFRRTLRAGSAIVAGLSAVALPALALLVPWIYGPAFASASPLVVVLGIAGGCLVVAAPVMAFTLARLSATRVLWASGSALVVDLALAVGLVPLLGVWGAVIANVAGSATQLGLLLRGELAVLHLTWRTVAWDVAPVGVGVLACLVAWGVSGAVAGLPVVAAVLAAVMGLALLVVGMRLSRSGLTEPDAAALLRNLPGSVARLVATPIGWLTVRSAR